MGKLHGVAAGVAVAILVVAAARADRPDVSAGRLLASWKDDDPGTRMVAEVIASAFASGQNLTLRTLINPDRRHPTGLVPLNFGLLCSRRNSEIHIVDSRDLT